MNFYARQQKSNLAVASRNGQILRAIDASVNDIGRRFTTSKGKRFSMIMSDQLKELHDVLVNDIRAGIKQQWNLSNKNTNINLAGYLQNVRISDELYKSFRTPNLGAMNAFMDRVDHGMNLSARVWNFTNGVQSEMEGILQSGILSGKSAVKISRELNGYISGKPIRYGGKLIKGRNVVHQAIRVAATEMNMAYRTASYLQNSRLPFVTGVTVHLSAAHPTLDICDDMQGAYPKGFEFIGWHPFCICFSTYNTIPPEQFQEYLQTGKLSAKGFRKGIPPRASRYVQNNGERFLKYKNPPYWLEDNFTKELKLRKFVTSAVVPKEPPVLMAPKKRKVTSIL